MWYIWSSPWFSPVHWWTKESFSNSRYSLLLNHSDCNLNWTLKSKNIKNLKYLKYKYQIYPEKNHDKAAMRHMYKSMENYLLDCFGPLEDHFQDDYYLAASRLQHWKLCRILLQTDLFIQINAGNSFSSWWLRYNFRSILHVSWVMLCIYLCIQI